MSASPETVTGLTPVQRILRAEMTPAEKRQVIRARIGEQNICDHGDYVVVDHHVRFVKGLVSTRGVCTLRRGARVTMKGVTDVVSSLVLDNHIPFELHRIIDIRKIEKPKL